MPSDPLTKKKTTARSPVCQSTTVRSFCHLIPGMKLLLGHGRSGSHWVPVTGTQMTGVCP